jgi:hypothetical protein
LYKQKNSDI